MPFVVRRGQVKALCSLQSLIKGLFALCFLFAVTSSHLLLRAFRSPLFCNVEEQSGRTTPINEKLDGQCFFTLLLFRFDLG